MHLTFSTATAVLVALSSPAYADERWSWGGSLANEYNYVPTGEILSEEPTLELWGSANLNENLSVTITAFSELSEVYRDPWQSQAAEIDFEIEGTFGAVDLGVGYYYYTPEEDGDIWVYGGIKLPLGFQFEAQRLEGYTNATSVGLSRPFEVAKVEVTPGFWHAEFKDYTSQTGYVQADIPLNNWLGIRLLGSSTQREFEDERDNRLTVGIVVARNE